MIGIYLVVLASIFMMFLPKEIVSYIELHPDGKISLLQMFTGQLLHFSWQHLFFDALALLICAIMINHFERKKVIWLLLVSLVVCGLTAEFGCQEFNIYRGLSGVSSTFYIALAIIITKRNRYLGGSAIILFGLKLVAEFSGAQALFGGDGFTPTPWVHLAGALVATAIILFPSCTKQNI